MDNPPKFSVIAIVLAQGLLAVGGLSGLQGLSVFPGGPEPIATDPVGRNNRSVFLRHSRAGV